MRRTQVVENMASVRSSASMVGTKRRPPSGTLPTRFPQPILASAHDSTSRPTASGKESQKHALISS